MAFPSPSHTISDAPHSTVTVQSLGSGSSGNAFLIRAGETTLLLDCGVGIRTITKALKDGNQRLDDLDAILITHEHSDHVRTLSCVVGRDIPIVSTAGTRRKANIPPPQWEQIDFHRPLTIGTVSVWAIMVSHDAAEPCGFLVETPETRVSVFTDLGTWHDRLVDPIRASDLVVLESNHDLELLLRGPYPAYLKKRVASTVGHLSNGDCALSLASTLKTATTRPEIWLAHLSETNNQAEIAERETSQALVESGLDLMVTPLPRRSPGPIWTPPQKRSDGTWAPKPKVPASLQLSFDSVHEGF